MVGYRLRADGKTPRCIGPVPSRDRGIDSTSPQTWRRSECNRPRRTHAAAVRHQFGVAMDLRAVISLLLDAGADPNVVDKDGMSLLQHALRVGSIDLVAALLSKGVNPNTADSTGATPVHAAALWSDASAMRLLLDHGAKDRSPRPIRQHSSARRGPRREQGGCSTSARRGALL